MENLVIEPTDLTPKIAIDGGSRVIEFSGESRPENVHKFYQPLISWLDKFETTEINNTSKPLIVKFNFDYFNSTSARFFISLMERFQKLNSEGVSVKVEWHYDGRDVDMKESGEELARLVSVPFVFIKN